MDNYRIDKHIAAIAMALLLFLGVLFQPTLFAYAEATVTSTEVANHFSSLEGGGWATGACLNFVRTQFQNLGGSNSSACCAYTYSKGRIVSSSMSDIPIGADVFFSGSGTTCHTCGNKAGHVGVYVGDGYMVHAMSGKIRKDKVQTIAGYSNLTYLVERSLIS